MGCQISQPALSMRGPPMPAKRAAGIRWRTARISSAPRASPEASPATMPIGIGASLLSAAVTAEPSTNDPAAGGLQKLGEPLQRGYLLRVGGDLLERFAIQGPVRAFDGRNVGG